MMYMCCPYSLPQFFSYAHFNPSVAVVAFDLVGPDRPNPAVADVSQEGVEDCAIKGDFVGGVALKKRDQSV